MSTRNNVKSQESLKKTSNIRLFPSLLIFLVDKVMRLESDLLELSAFVDLLVDALVDAVEDDGDGAHQSRLQHCRVTFLKIKKILTLEHLKVLVFILIRAKCTII